MPVAELNWVDVDDLDFEITYDEFGMSLTCTKCKWYKEVREEYVKLGSLLDYASDHLKEKHL